jgi:hypothetical protein
MIKRIKYLIYIMRKPLMLTHDSDSDTDEEYDEMIKKAQTKKKVIKGTPLKTKDEVDLANQHTNFLKHLVSERKKEVIRNEVEKMLKDLEKIESYIQSDSDSDSSSDSDSDNDSDSDSDSELDEDDMRELYANLNINDSDSDNEYIGDYYEIEERPKKRPPIPRARTQPTTKVPSKPTKMIPRQRVEKPEPIRMPSSIKDLKITPRARKPTPTPNKPTPTPKKPTPKPRARAISYKGLSHKFEQPSIGLGFKGARQLKEEMKLKKAIKERKEEEPKKKRGRPKKEEKPKTLRERKASDESFQAKK